MESYEAKTGSAYNVKLDGGYIGGTSQPTKAETPIMREYNELDKSLAELGMSLEALRLQLAPVLGPERTNGEKDDGNVPESSLCPIASNMRSDRKRVNRMWLDVQDLLNRLEV